MSYPFRDTLHRSRKAVVHRLDRLWPQASFADVTERIHYKTRPPYSDPGPAIMPEQAHEGLADRAEAEDEEAVFRVKVPCTVDPKMGLLFVNGRVVWGSTDNHVRERNPKYLTHMMGPVERLPSAILLHHIHGDNYFHFFTLIINRVRVIESLGLPDDIPFLVTANTASTRFFQEAVKLGIFGKRKVVVQGKRKVFRVDEAYVVRGFFLYGPYLQWLCDRLGVPEIQEDGAPLFVIRKPSAANGRIFRNQQAVNDLVGRYGFELIDPGDLLFEEQVRTFSRAPAIAGAHGAGLTNLIFRRSPPCTFVELFFPGMGSPHYYMLAREKGFDYASMMTDDPQGRAFTASTHVDLDQLKAILDRF
ncbi:glycosyltransferase family 61 protein [Roseibium aggregatum]|uniref:Glycosyltransferase family 61 protein n=1 Tax=Roseibium aggregatum TaxID=187304 RepID=A0A926P2G2_9HYPH|nr:glycosyltransferase family 61 protein [Roseibium aggregatum]MBD1548315.1 glycosyltransferase family 61 protein [Roseibium aggregatum]